MPARAVRPQLLRESPSQPSDGYSLQEKMRRLGGARCGARQPLRAPAARRRLFGLSHRRAPDDWETLECRFPEGRRSVPRSPEVRFLNTAGFVFKTSIPNHNECCYRWLVTHLSSAESGLRVDECCMSPSSVRTSVLLGLGIRLPSYPCWRYSGEPAAPALAARTAGCSFPDCSRAVTWCRQLKGRAGGTLAGVDDWTDTGV